MVAPAWHPVALSADIEPGIANGTRILGREIVVWRDASGAAHVWDDRCRHRGMRPSFGFVGVIGSSFLSHVTELEPPCAGLARKATRSGRVSPSCV